MSAWIWLLCVEGFGKRMRWYLSVGENRVTVRYWCFSRLKADHEHISWIKCVDILSLEDTTILTQKDWLAKRFGFTQMYQLHPVDDLTVQSLTQLCLRACADKPRRLPHSICVYFIFPDGPVAHVAPSLQPPIISKLWLCLLAVSLQFHLDPAKKTRAALTFKSLDYDTIGCILHVAFTDLKISISLDGFIPPACTKPH